MLSPPYCVSNNAQPENSRSEYQSDCFGLSKQTKQRQIPKLVDNGPNFMIHRENILSKMRIKNKCFLIHDQR